ncbi:MAG: GNAT family N-acetyltransferase [gamma proteobacterium symbiont of Ctena orbiculata]|nr:GNAT family N-acetyltransferase [Candidatus Thiodiazotropha taylori]PUB87607.1 MAG: GNAT family N-acetyltransferase [gamma proteobacterium symbiont of Ctena orbiculata]MBT2996272.1 GNAT family N-acetyltransferase [Candidatus Thiodiazotropha taylori]MBT3000294.1 GNAT family N-acetyltransferase [Candidatus Thiodiazotropha taylori]MBT3028109.1 GNAT family N-acetyltransferase [Candidatus Thiodiazotropha taylori]
MNIRKFQDSDWSQVWPIIEKVFRAGDSYAFSPGITEQEAFKVWVQIPRETYVATTDDGEVAGTYYIKPNQPGLGSHVCNCGYIVSEAARGRGVASRMCEHSQQVAVEAGFRAMQYNLVVSTNEGAIRLWKKLGFQAIGTLPNAYDSKSAGYIDALVMYKQLNT